MLVSLNISATTWTPRIQHHLPSVQCFTKASDSCSEVIQLSPRQAAENKVGVSPFWVVEGYE